MLTAIFRALFTLAGCFFFYTLAKPLLELVSIDPVESVQFLAAVVASAAVLRLIVRLMDPRRTVAHAHAQAARFAAVAVLEEDASAERGFDRTRRARHEAAHAVIALHVGRENVIADVMIYGSRGGQVTYETPAGPIADTAYADMLISFGGHIVDIQSGRFDGGSQVDMRSLTEAALLILSTGLRPAGYSGELTLEALVCTARDDATRILDEQAGVVDAITIALEQDRRLTWTRLIEISAEARAEVKS